MAFSMILKFRHPFDMDSVKFPAFVKLKTTNDLFERGAGGGGGGVIED